MPGLDSIRRSFSEYPIQKTIIISSCVVTLIFWGIAMGGYAGLPGIGVANSTVLLEMGTISFVIGITLFVIRKQKHKKFLLSEKNKCPTSVNDLPNEILMMIFALLSPQDQNSLTLSCTKFHSILLNNFFFNKNSFLLLQNIQQILSREGKDYSNIRRSLHPIFSFNLHLRFLRRLSKFPSVQKSTDESLKALIEDTKHSQEHLKLILDCQIAKNYAKKGNITETLKCLDSIRDLINSKSNLFVNPYQLLTETLCSIIVSIEKLDTEKAKKLLEEVKSILKKYSTYSFNNKKTAKKLILACIALRDFNYLHETYKYMLTHSLALKYKIKLFRIGQFDFQDPYKFLCIVVNEIPLWKIPEFLALLRKQKYLNFIDIEQLKIKVFTQKKLITLFTKIMDSSDEFGKIKLLRQITEISFLLKLNYTGLRYNELFEITLRESIEFLKKGLPDSDQSHLDIEKKEIIRLFKLALKLDDQFSVNLLEKLNEIELPIEFLSSIIDVTCYLVAKKAIKHRNYQNLSIIINGSSPERKTSILLKLYDGLVKQRPVNQSMSLENPFGT